VAPAEVGEAESRGSPWASPRASQELLISKSEEV
jgi:hypothetical protein